MNNKFSKKNSVMDNGVNDNLTPKEKNMNNETGNKNMKDKNNKGVTMSEDSITKLIVTESQLTTGIPTLASNRGFISTNEALVGATLEDQIEPIYTNLDKIKMVKCPDLVFISDEDNSVCSRVISSKDHEVYMTKVFKPIVAKGKFFSSKVDAITIVWNEFNKEGLVVLFKDGNIVADYTVDKISRFHKTFRSIRSIYGVYRHNISDIAAFGKDGESKMYKTLRDHDLVVVDSEQTDQTDILNIVFAVALNEEPTKPYHSPLFNGMTYAGITELATFIRSRFDEATTKATHDWVFRIGESFKITDQLTKANDALQDYYKVVKEAKDDNTPIAKSVKNDTFLQLNNDIVSCREVVTNTVELGNKEFIMYGMTMVAKVLNSAIFAEYSDTDNTEYRNVGATITNYLYELLSTIGMDDLNGIEGFNDCTTAGIKSVILEASTKIFESTSSSAFNNCDIYLNPKGIVDVDQYTIWLKHQLYVWSLLDNPMKNIHTAYYTLHNNKLALCNTYKYMEESLNKLFTKFLKSTESSTNTIIDIMYRNSRQVLVMLLINNYLSGKMDDELKFTLKDKSILVFSNWMVAFKFSKHIVEYTDSKIITDVFDQMVVTNDCEFACYSTEGVIEEYPEEWDVILVLPEDMDITVKTKYIKQGAYSAINDVTNFLNTINTILPVIDRYEVTDMLQMEVVISNKRSKYDSMDNSAEAMVRDVAVKTRLLTDGIIAYLNDRVYLDKLSKSLEGKFRYMISGIQHTELAYDMITWVLGLDLSKFNIEQNISIYKYVMALAYVQPDTFLANVQWINTMNDTNKAMYNNAVNVATNSKEQIKSQFNYWNAPVNAPLYTHQIIAKLIAECNVSYVDLFSNIYQGAVLQDITNCDPNANTNANVIRLNAVDKLPYNEVAHFGQVVIVTRELLSANLDLTDDTTSIIDIITKEHDAFPVADEDLDGQGIVVYNGNDEIAEFVFHNQVVKSLAGTGGYAIKATAVALDVNDEYFSAKVFAIFWNAHKTEQFVTEMRALVTKYNKPILTGNSTIFKNKTGAIHSDTMFPTEMNSTDKYFNETLSVANDIHKVTQDISIGRGARCYTSQTVLQSLVRNIKLDKMGIYAKVGANSILACAHHRQENVVLISQSVYDMLNAQFKKAYSMELTNINGIFDLIAYPKRYMDRLMSFEVYPDCVMPSGIMFPSWMMNRVDRDFDGDNMGIAVLVKRGNPLLVPGFIGSVEDTKAVRFLGNNATAVDDMYGILVQNQLTKQQVGVIKLYEVVIAKAKLLKYNVDGLSELAKSYYDLTVDEFLKTEVSTKISELPTFFPIIMNHMEKLLNTKLPMPLHNTTPKMDNLLLGLTIHYMLLGRSVSEGVNVTGALYSGAAEGCEITPLIYAEANLSCQNEYIIKGEKKAINFNRSLYAVMILDASKRKVGEYARKQRYMRHIEESKGVANWEVDKSFWMHADDYKFDLIQECTWAVCKLRIAYANNEPQHKIDAMIKIVNDLHNGDDKIILKEFNFNGETRSRATKVYDTKMGFKHIAMMQTEEGTDKYNKNNSAKNARIRAFKKDITNNKGV